VVLLGQIAEPVREMSKADVLVEMEAEERGPSVFLSTKVMEYLSTDRIIVGIVNAKSPTSSLLRSLPLSTIRTGHDPSSVGEALIRAIDLRWTLSMDDERRTVLASFTGAAVAKTLCTVFSDCLERTAVV
jgi:hypothetical protein